MAATVPTLDTSLIATAREGRVVLFVGAGASLGARNKKGEAMPDGPRLGELIANKFLRPEHATLDFKTICDFACAESSVRDVQRFIHDTLINFEPTPAHREIPKFIWAGIAGTNYDLLIERSYEVKDAVQKIIPYTKNGSGAIERLGIDGGSGFIRNIGQSRAHTATQLGNGHERFARGVVLRRRFPSVLRAVAGHCSRTPARSYRTAAAAIQGLVPSSGYERSQACTYPYAPIPASDHPGARAR